MLTITLVLIASLPGSKGSGHGAMVCPPNAPETVYSLKTSTCPRSSRTEVALLSKTNDREITTPVEAWDFISHYCEGVKWFFGTKTQKEWSHIHHPSPSELLFLKEVRPGSPCCWVWPQSCYNSVLEIRKTDHLIHTRPGGPLVSSAGPMRDCIYEKGTCLLGTGRYLRWRPSSDYNVTEIKMGLKNVTITRDSVTIASMGLSLSVLEERERVV